MIAASLDDPVQTGDGTLGETIADPAPSPQAAAQRREQSRLVLAALQELRLAERTVVILRDLEGHSYEEIAAILRCRVGTVKSRLNRARLQLRALLDGRLA